MPIGLRDRARFGFPIQREIKTADAVRSARVSNALILGQRAFDADHVETEHLARAGVVHDASDELLAIRPRLAVFDLPAAARYQNTRIFAVTAEGRIVTKRHGNVPSHAGLVAASEAR